jgi:hypothetical protein
MPIAVQLIAAPWREDIALRAAKVLQDAGVAYLRYCHCGLDPQSMPRSSGSSTVDPGSSPG